MWARNLLFLTLCLLGFSAVGATLLRKDWIEEPDRFIPQHHASPDFQATLAQVNQQFRRHWEQHELAIAPRADDLIIARRLSLGLMGTTPSLEEVRALDARSDEERLDWWLARILEDRRYADYVAERLARAYVGTENGPFLVYRRRRFVTWLSDQIAANVRYDRLVSQLISDEGLWTDTPSVNFLTATSDQNNGNQPDPIRLAGRTTRAFLGMRIDCLQCHDDRLGNVALGEPDDPREGLQSDFHQLAAFFGGTQSSLLGIRDREGAYRYQYLDAEDEQLVPPVPPFSAELLESGGTQRQQLARWITHPENKPFARATVNRVWALMFGRPLVEPIDNIPLFGQYPPGLETLADDFIRHGYDVRRLIRLIASSEVYQRDSQAEFEVLPTHEAQWAVFPLTRLRPEQMAGGLIQACSLTTIDANSHIIAQFSRFIQQNEFINRYGDMGEDEFQDGGGTVTQRLLMMNGDLVKKRTESNPLVNAATRIAILAPDNATAVETTYLAVLTRRPTDEERQHFVQRLAKMRGQKRQQALEDLYWVLLNSSEFTWNH